MSDTDKLQKFFDLLGISITASPIAIKKAWKDKCKEHHPDRGGDEQMFKAIMHAYEMITDPSYRFKHEDEVDVKDKLNFYVNLVATFEEGFFGKEIQFSYNQIKFDKDFKMIKQEVVKPKTVKIKMAPGSTQHYQKILMNQGHIMETQVGNLIINIVIGESERYVISNGSVYTEDEIPFETMLCGGYADIQTLWGIKTITIPPGSWPGTEFYIPGCGVDQKNFHNTEIVPCYPTEHQMQKTWNNIKLNWNISEKEKRKFKKK